MVQDKIRRKIALVVEHETAIGRACQRVLKAQGFEVDIVSDGKAAQESVEKQQYDLLLLDIRLPIVNGIELYVWLQQEYPQLSKRVIFMTGSVMGGETMTLLERSGQPYLLKPFRPEELVEIVIKTLGEIEK